MNKTFVNAVAVSLLLHASTISAARHGGFASVISPLQEMARLEEMKRQSQSALNFTFVDSPETQLRDEEPVRKSRLISDKSTEAKDMSKAASQPDPDAPHVEKPAPGKQVGRMAGMAQPARPAAQQAMQQPVPPEPKTAPRAEPKPAVMKAEKIEEPAAEPEVEPKPVVAPAEDARLKEQYMVKIKELQNKIDQAQKKLKENEDVLRRRKEEAQQKRTQQEEEDLLREFEERYGKKPSQPSAPSKGGVGFGGASLHNASSDVQGDVERFGELSFNASRYELGEYFKKMKLKVEEFWLPYLAFTYSGGNLFGNKTVVFFKIMPDGKVKDAKILEHSGDELLRDFCLAAVQSIAPFDPLPAGFVKRTGYAYLPIVFTFNY